MKKQLLRVFSLALIGIMMLSTLVCAQAATKGTTESSVSFTITTGKKDSTLKLSNTKGKLEYDKISYVGFPPKQKIKKATANVYGTYLITVTPKGGKSSTKTMNGSSASISLKANTIYSVTVSYQGISGFNLYANWKWKKNPSWKVKSVSNGAKAK